MPRGRLPDVSSTENPRDAEQAPEVAAEETAAQATGEEAVAEVTAEMTQTVAVTPDAGTPAAPAPDEAQLTDPTVDVDGAVSGAATDPAEATAEPAEPVERAEPVEPAQPAEPVEAVEAAATTPHVIPGPRGMPAHTPAPAPAAPAPPAEEVVEDPSLWGRVDDDGTVYVRTADGERLVGSWQAGEPAEGLAHYARRYAD